MKRADSNPCSEALPPDETVFTRYVLGLYSTAMIHLGRIPDPDTDKRIVNVPLARESVQYLEVLRAKTQGNLAPEEIRVLDDVLGRAKKCLEHACASLGDHAQSG